MRCGGLFRHSLAKIPRPLLRVPLDVSNEESMWV